MREYRKSAESDAIDRARDQVKCNMFNEESGKKKIGRGRNVQPIVKLMKITQGSGMYHGRKWSRMKKRRKKQATKMEQREM